MVFRVNKFTCVCFKKTQHKPCFVCLLHKGRFIGWSLWGTIISCITIFCLGLAAADIAAVNIADTGGKGLQ
jgi:hypothetical protein